MMKPQLPATRAFTLIEVMVSVGILAVIMLIVASFTQQASKTWLSSQAKIESFQGARAGFESLTRRLSQTTLNNYYGYDNPEAPTYYLRKSELHFICGKSLLPTQVTHAVFFQAPLGYTDDANYEGMENLLNACGYYVEYNGDERRPVFLDSLDPAVEKRYRYRLMQFTQPAQSLAVYNTTQGNDWFRVPLQATEDRPVRPLAENVVALVILPKRTTGDQRFKSDVLSPGYEYNTRDSTNPDTLNQLPPLLEVLMVAIDEPSASRLGNSTSAPLRLDDLFQQSTKLYDDLSALEGRLTGNSPKLNYRVFRSEVPIRTAKWSTYEPSRN